MLLLPLPLPLLLPLLPLVVIQYYSQCSQYPLEHTHTLRHTRIVCSTLCRFLFLDILLNLFLVPKTFSFHTANPVSDLWHFPIVNLISLLVLLLLYSFHPLAEVEGEEKGEGAAYPSTVAKANWIVADWYLAHGLHSAQQIVPWVTISLWRS